MQEYKATGTQISYFYICHTKLWYFSNHIQMEHNSDLVAQGRHIDETAYRREKKHEMILGKIALDFVRKGDEIEIHEVKKSKKMEKAHEMQVLYYLYVLKQRGLKAKAVLDYPVMRERKVLELTREAEEEIEKAMFGIEKILSQALPPEPARKQICKKCSYYELCWGD